LVGRQIIDNYFLVNTLVERVQQIQLCLARRMVRCRIWELLFLAGAVYGLDFHTRFGGIGWDGIEWNGMGWGLSTALNWCDWLGLILILNRDD